MFTEVVKCLIKQKGISVNKMLKDLGMGTGTFRTWESRGTVPNGETLQKIADYFDVSVDYLLGKEADQSQEDKNTITLRGRDGSYSKKTLTDEQIKMLQAMINSLPEAPDDL